MNDVERLWNLHRHAIVDACHFGVTIAADHPHDTVADRKDGDRRTYSDDFPRDFQAQKSGAAEVRTAVPASALGQVGTVQARGANADQKIGQPQFGFGYLGDLQDVGVAKSSAAAEMKELGVGINTLPHGIRELTSLGLLPELDRIAMRTRELRYLTHLGQAIRRLGITPCRCSP